MEKILIEYDGKEYEVQEPTLALWNKLQLMKELQNPDDFAMSIISLSTGLDTEDIRKAGWYEISNAAAHLTDYFLQQTDKFYPEFEFEGVKYKFIDLKNMTFGEFIDIDNFLKKPEAERRTQLNFLMALLYRPCNEEGVIEPYDASQLEQRSNIFRFLPVKYLNGSMRFFLTLETILQDNTPFYFQRVSLWRKVRTKVSTGIGAGIRLLCSSLVKTFYKLKKWLSNLL